MLGEGLVCPPGGLSIWEGDLSWWNSTFGAATSGHSYRHSTDTAQTDTVTGLDSYRHSTDTAQTQHRQTQ